MTEPAWLPDPSGRHDLRWFDGTAFTDQVADAGVQSTDAGPAVPVAGVVPPSDLTGKRASRVPLILAAAGALVVVIAVVTLIGGDGDGSGTFDGEVTGREVGRHEVSLGAGSVVVIEVEPSAELDAVVSLELETADRSLVEDLYEDTPLAGFLLRRDVGFAGDDEDAFLAVPFGVDVTVEVSGFEGSEGQYEITIDVVDLDVDEDATGEDLIEAMSDSEEVPRAVKAQLESLLD